MVCARRDGVSSLAFCVALAQALALILGIGWPVLLWALGLVIALTAGAALSEHENPGEATIAVLEGRVQMDAGGHQWQGRAGDLLLVPPSRHALTALEDAVVLLTVAKPDRA